MWLLGGLVAHRPALPSHPDAELSGSAPELAREVHSHLPQRSGSWRFPFVIQVPCPQA